MHPSNDGHFSNFRGSNKTNRSNGGSDGNLGGRTSSYNNKKPYSHKSVNHILSSCKGMKEIEAVTLLKKHGNNVGKCVTEFKNSGAGGTVAAASLEFIEIGGSFVDKKNNNKKVDKKHELNQQKKTKQQLHHPQQDKASLAKAPKFQPQVNKKTEKKGKPLLLDGEIPHNVFPDAYTQKLTEFEITCLRSRFFQQSLEPKPKNVIPMAQIPQIFNDVVGFELQRGKKKNDRGEGYLVKEMLWKIGLCNRDGWTIKGPTLERKEVPKSKSGSGSIEEKKEVGSSQAVRNVATDINETETEPKSSEYTQQLTPSEKRALLKKFQTMHDRGEPIHLPNMPNLFEEVVGFPLEKGNKFVKNPSHSINPEGKKKWGYKKGFLVKEMLVSIGVVEKGWKIGQCKLEYVGVGDGDGDGVGGGNIDEDEDEDEATRKAIEEVEAFKREEERRGSQNSFNSHNSHNHSSSYASTGFLDGDGFVQVDFRGGKSLPYPPPNRFPQASSLTSNELGQFSVESAFQGVVNPVAPKVPANFENVFTKGSSNMASGGNDFLSSDPPITINTGNFSDAFSNFSSKGPNVSGLGNAGFVSMSLGLGSSNGVEVDPVDGGVNSLIDSLSLPVPPAAPVQPDIVPREAVPSALGGAPPSPPHEKKKRIRVKKNRSASYDAKNIDHFTPKFDDRGKPSVQFTVVNVKVFPRDLGFCSLPADGGWPLGMTNEGNDELIGNLEAFEDRRESELRMRTNDLNLSDEEKLNARGETRQYDHRPRERKNPLFGRIKEAARKKLILASVDEDFEQHEQHRKRGLSDADLEDTEHMMKAFEINDNNRDIKNELDKIRIERSENGCGCHRLKNFSKMSEHRIKDELRKRHLSDSEMTNMSKSELQAMLKEFTSKEKCCGVDCECEAAGIKCHWEVCGCFSKENEEGLGSDQEKCGNSVGFYSFSNTVISAYRKRAILNWESGICSETTE